MFDRHGSLDILLDSDWSNLVLSPASGAETYADEKTFEITGASFNSLLLGLIIYHGYLKPSSSELLGGTQVWGHMMEHVLSMLPASATIPEIMVRIVLILQGYLMEVHDVEEHINAALSRNDKLNRHPMDLSNLWYGSINFIKFWISEYSEFFSDLQIKELEQSVLDMCKRLNAMERVMTLKFHDGEIDKSSRGNIALIDMTAHMCLKLRHQVGSIAHARSWHSMGFSPPAPLGHLSSRADVALVLPFSHVSPSVSQFVGTWTGDEKDKNKRRALAAAAGNKDFGLFGGASALANNDDSDSDEEEQAVQNDTTRLEVRIPDGFDLKGEDKVHFWSLDCLELARQWTLADHKLFQSIPPHQLLNRNWADPRYAHTTPSIRRFIDRFNCVSNWTSSSILTGRTPENRAAIYEHILKLAHYFRQLHNFHSMMAILTGLQRGCITRLTQTFELISPQSKDILKRLLQDMNGSKNYLAYRNILEKFFRGKFNGAFIPHLGAHLAEMTAVDEGNSDYVNSAPHLLNVVKLKLFARPVMQLADLQKYRYNLTPVRIVSCAVDKALQPFVFLTNADVSENERKLFNLSMEREPNKAIAPAGARAADDSDSGDERSSEGEDSGEEDQEDD